MGSGARMLLIPAGFHYCDCKGRNRIADEAVTVWAHDPAYALY